MSFTSFQKSPDVIYGFQDTGGHEIQVVFISAFFGLFSGG
jgi:hypothetical protein